MLARKVIWGQQMQELWNNIYNHSSSEEASAVCTLTTATLKPKQDMANPLQYPWSQSRKDSEEVIYPSQLHPAVQECVWLQQKKQMTKLLFFLVTYCLLFGCLSLSLSFSYAAPPSLLLLQILGWWQKTVEVILQFCQGLLFLLTTLFQSQYDCTAHYSLAVPQIITFQFVDWKHRKLPKAGTECEELFWL